MTEIIQKQQTQLTPTQRLRSVLDSPVVQEQFRNALQESAPLFVASLIDVVSNDKMLAACNPNDIIREALKAATLKLPINKGLGFAWLVPFKEKGVPKPQFQIGYRGYIQLALRTAQYRYINADVLLEGELKKSDKLTGEIDLTGEASSDKVVGYFAHLETINGYRKTLYMTMKQVEAHAKRYSKSYGTNFSPWKSDFDKMALKTVITLLLKRYGILSVDMLGAFDSDSDERTGEAKAGDDIAAFANTEEIGFTEAPAEAGEPQKEQEGGATKKAPF